MANRCLKCKKELNCDHFICPHCGAIIGDPVSYAATAKIKQPKKRRISFRMIVTVVLITVLVALLGAVAWLVHPFFMEQPTTVATNPTTTVPAPTQMTAPLTIYTVQLSTINKTDLKGTSIHIYNDDQAFYSSQVGEDGTATFILPESNGYSIRLTDLPVQYQVNYDDVTFQFEEGQQHLDVTLEEMPVPYTIKVTNSAGEPLPGTGIIFYSSGEESQQQVTDENGICTFMTYYGVGTCSAAFSFVPNGYILQVPYILFPKDQLVFDVELLTYEEADVKPGDVYTVRVVDEYGDPVPYISLSLVGNDPSIDVSISRVGTTNMDGCYSFVSTNDVQYDVSILQNADYYDVVFRFEEGSRELLIQLDLHKEPGTKYTYTVSFMDYSGQPIAGVEIAYQPPDSDEMQYYTSDENGLVTFKTITADPSAVKYTITSVPDGYYTNRPDDALYGFSAYQRSTFVRLYYDGEVIYTIFLLDDVGQSVASAELYIWNNRGLFGNIITDEEGKTKFRDIPAADWNFTIQYLPEPYTDYVIEKIDYGEGHSIYITIAPSDTNNVYTVTFQHPETGTAIPGVQIAVADDRYSVYRDDTEFYTSDENGMVTFESTKADPAAVSFYVISCPDDYTTVLHEYTQYSFQAYSRNLTVSMQYDGKVAYKVYLKDQKGQPVPYSYITFKLDEDYWVVSMDDQGFGTFRIYPDEDFRMEKVSLGDYPDEYTYYVVAKVEYGEDRCIYITIEPSPIPNQGGNDE